MRDRQAFWGGFTFGAVATLTAMTRAALRMYGARDWRTKPSH